MPFPSHSHPREREVFLDTLEIQDAKERLLHLDKTCGGDEILRARVEALLKFAELPHLLEREPGIFKLKLRSSKQSNRPQPNASS